LLLATVVLGATLARAQQAAAPVADSVTVAIAPEYAQVSKAHRLLFGNSYRAEWATPVHVPVLHLATAKGGFTVLQRGGGGQTRSLRLRDPSGREWALRMVQKDPVKGLPATLRHTIAGSVLQDQTASSHPLAPLTVPPLAEALHIAHANPELVYVGDDPVLGQYRPEFANQVYLLEERKPGALETNSDNTAKTQQRLEKDHDNRVDQRAVLRARLLDLLLGDYDRHEDQWRWQRVKTADGTLYEPVPRDHDHVFYKPDGLLLWAVSRHLMQANVQGYSGHIRSIGRWNTQARYFDRYFLNALDEQDWRQEVALVQRTLTDSLFDQALHQMPAAMYRLSGPEIARKFRARRAGLLRQALHYYRFLAREVDVPASGKREQLTVARQAGGQLRVTIAKLNKAGVLGDTTYQRTFDPGVTHEVRLYGLAGADSFRVAGAGRSRIRVRLIGGAGADAFAVAPAAPRPHVYDTPAEANALPPPGRARRHLGPDTVANAFDRTGFRYGFVQPLLTAGYSVDYGVQIGTTINWQRPGFRKLPYASRQSLLVNYGFAWSSLLLGYTGDFRQALWGNDLLVSVVSKGPNYTSHFFGLGNNTAFNRDNSQTISYYRSFYNLLTADVRLARTLGPWRLSAGPTAQYYGASATQNGDRLLATYAAQYPEEEVFRRQAYGGLAAEVLLDTRDHGLLTRRGVLWRTSLAGLRRFTDEPLTYGQLQTDFTLHLMPTADSSLVMAVRVGGGTTVGEANYFQQLNLGGAQNLRGFYLWRFTGRTMFYHNLDVHFKLATFQSYVLPGTLGLVAFNDIGRVWQPGEDSQRWHDGYGGGLYYLPAQLLLVQAVVGFSREGAYPYISVGVRL
jgi:hypothetical protein